METDFTAYPSKEDIATFKNETMPTYKCRLMSIKDNEEGLTQTKQNALKISHCKNIIALIEIHSKNEDFSPKPLLQAMIILIDENSPLTDTFKDFLKINRDLCSSYVSQYYKENFAPQPNVDNDTTATATPTQRSCARCCII